MNPVPGEVSLLEEIDGFTVMTPSPPGKDGRPDVVPGAVGAAAVLLGVISGVLFGPGVGAIFVLPGLAGIAIALVINRRPPTPVKLALRGTTLHVESAAGTEEILLARIASIQVRGWDLVFLAQNKVTLCTVGVSSRGTAQWVAELLRKQLVAPGDVPPGLQALREQ
ncbi:MAG: hypothetical protein EP330_22955 [Deltaproteobacteria bacterium]|nr:MAG: hypothetical protein EP330_22955 [Deltaproteobacteria bacterium]